MAALTAIIHNSKAPNRQSADSGLCASWQSVKTRLRTFSLFYFKYFAKGLFIFFNPFAMLWAFILAPSNDV